MFLRRVALTGLIAASLGLLHCTITQEEDPPVVGAPCIPSLEGNAGLAGFRVTETTIEFGSPQCGSGVCLVNHFQGRVSCPLGQPAPTDAQGLSGCTPEVSAQGEFIEAQGSCKSGDLCVSAGSRSPSCDPSTGADADQSCQSSGAGTKCNSEGFCECQQDADCLFVTDATAACDPKSKQCVVFACKSPGGCQDASAPASQNAGKDCCAPGTSVPLTTAVCGQCKGTGSDEPTRDAEGAVYCTCRCGVAEGAPDEPDFDFCECPDGFECSEINPNVGLGDPEATGKFCIKAGTAYDSNEDQCGFVDGYWSSGGDDVKCAGVPTNKCQSPDGPCED